MIKISQLKLRPGYTEDDLLKKVSDQLKINKKEILDVKLLKRSIDARKKPDIFEVLTISVRVRDEKAVLRKKGLKDVTPYEPLIYTFVPEGESNLSNRPVVVGAGPCGLFAAYELAAHGYRPLIIERGQEVDERTVHVEDFFKTGLLKPESNVLFGEGGAGTFSDGKLNTLVNDKKGRNNEVLDIFVRYGAPESIKYDSKPHIGTDVLRTVIKNMRLDMIKMGAEFRFGTKLTDIVIKDGSVAGIEVNGDEIIGCEVLILCIGHSARDTFKLLYDKNIKLEQKDFAVGFRVEHPQAVIDRALYTDDEKVLELLPHAPYKLAYHSDKFDRGVYSFCMCPGGFVVNASSEPGLLCVNGMSYSKRDGLNANSAIVVSVGSKDFESPDPLAGIDFQRKIERKAYEAGGGKIPVETFIDFKKDVEGPVAGSNGNLEVYYGPQSKGEFSFAKVSDILPDELNRCFIEGMEYFDRIISGFSADNALVSGVEARTSSPVRIVRDEDLQSVSLKGLYPGGEGAGYAGGITSAAMDGLKIYEAVTKVYKAF